VFKVDGLLPSTFFLMFSIVFLVMFTTDSVVSNLYYEGSLLVASCNLNKIWVKSTLVPPTIAKVWISTSHVKTG
jgi:hypothetical protein